MQIVEDIHELRRRRAELPGPFGLVPTMGALHAGHCSLITQARSECDSVGVSIFVNPAQFGPNEDLGQYPRNLEQDLAILEPMGVDLVWVPKPEVVYPAGFQTHISLDELSCRLEGHHRPGHFRGVATVVTKLFNVFTPDRAYFGQKDAQQIVVIRQMVADLNFALEIVVCPTVRDPDGLAVSSRNAYLCPQERSAACILYRALLAASAEYEAGERNAVYLRSLVVTALSKEPLAKTEYVSLADPATLVELARVEGRALLSLAVRIGSTRLIDNLVLPSGRL